MFKKPFFSIVIPTLDEEKYLPLLLGDLVQQTLTNFEVIHVDGNSNDHTVKAASQFKRRFPLRIKVSKKQNVANQRNAGAQLARGEWVIFMDADNRLPNYFLQGIKYQLEKNPQTGVFTTWVKTNQQTSLSKTIDSAINFGYELYHIVGKEAAIGALIRAKKTATRKVKFNEKQKIFEDSLFVKDCVAAGYHFKIFHEPRYLFSLRRFEKEGSLKMARIAAASQLNYILCKSFEHHNYGYVMEGGKYYDRPSRSPFINLQRFIQKASKKRLTRAKQLLNNL